MPLSNQGRNYVLRTGSFRGAATHIGLFTSSPGSGGSGANELPSSNGYARQAITWATNGDGSDRNSNVINFTNTGGTNWGAATYWGLCGSGTRGNNDVRMYDTLPSTTVAPGGICRFNTSSIVVNVPA